MRQSFRLNLSAFVTISEIIVFRVGHFKSYNVDPITPMGVVHAERRKIDIPHIMGPYYDGMDEEVTFFSSAGLDKKGQVIRRSHTRRRKVKSRLGTVTRRQLSERQKTVGLAIAGLSILVLVGYILHFRQNDDVTLGVAGQKRVPQMKAKAKVIGGDGINTVSGVHGNPGEDDDWYDDKFQRLVPTKHISLEVNKNFVAKGSVAEARSSGLRNKLNVKDLIEIVENDEEEDDDDGVIEEKYSSKKNVKSEGKSHNDNSHTLNGLKWWQRWLWFQEGSPRSTI